jgi:WhiB family redox-sensing transcriptional regulator
LERILSAPMSPKSHPCRLEGGKLGAVTARRNGLPILAEALDLTTGEMFAPPAADWRSQSLCSQRPVAEADALFFPQRGQSTKAARAPCSRCPVRAPCLEFALSDEYALMPGVWGGTSPRERRGLRAAG